MNEQARADCKDYDGYWHDDLRYLKPNMHINLFVYVARRH